jgi:hypothetical protein
MQRVGTFLSPFQYHPHVAPVCGGERHPLGEPATGIPFGSAETGVLIYGPVMSSKAEAQRALDDARFVLELVDSFPHND